MKQHEGYATVRADRHGIYRQFGAATRQDPELLALGRHFEVRREEYRKVGIDQPRLLKSFLLLRRRHPAMKFSEFISGASPSKQKAKPSLFDEDTLPEGDTVTGAGLQELIRELENGVHPVALGIRGEFLTGKEDEPKGPGTQAIQIVGIENEGDSLTIVCTTPGLGRTVRFPWAMFEAAWKTSGNKLLIPDGTEPAKFAGGGGSGGTARPDPPRPPDFFDLAGAPWARPEPQPSVGAKSSSPKAGSGPGQPSTPAQPSFDSLPRNTRAGGSGGSLLPRPGEQIGSGVGVTGVKMPKGSAPVATSADPVGQLLNNYQNGRYPSQFSAKGKPRPRKFSGITLPHPTDTEGWRNFEMNDLRSATKRAMKASPAARGEIGAAFKKEAARIKSPKYKPPTMPGWARKGGDNFTFAKQPKPARGFTEEGGRVYLSAIGRGLRKSRMAKMADSPELQRVRTYLGGFGTGSNTQAAPAPRPPATDPYLRRLDMDAARDRSNVGMRPTDAGYNRNPPAPQSAYTATPQGNSVNPYGVAPAPIYATPPRITNPYIGFAERTKKRNRKRKRR